MISAMPETFMKRMRLEEWDNQNLRRPPRTSEQDNDFSHMAHVLLIRTPPDARMLLKSPSIYQEIKILIPNAPAATSRHWEQKLTKALQDCGCQTAAQFATVGIIAALAWYLLATSSFAVSGLFFYHLIAGAVVGSTLGRIVSRIRARSTIRQTAWQIIRYESAAA
jgi:hypothetical protein